MNILERIQNRYPHLTKRQKEIADYLLENPEDICYITLAQLSQKTSVSEVTLLRFCNKIECESFLKMKDEFREYTQDMVKRLSSSSYVVPTFHNTGEQGKKGVLQEICAEEAAAATEFFSTFNLDTIADAVKMLREHRHIYVFAHDISKIPAEFLVSRLQLLYLNAEMVDLSDLTETQDILMNLGKGDMAIYFAFPKYYYPSASITRQLSGKGIPILGITDSIDSPIAGYADCLLQCHTETKVFHNSLTLPMALINLLASYLVIDTVPDSDRESFFETLSS